MLLAQRHLTRILIMSLAVGKVLYKGLGSTGGVLCPDIACMAGVLQSHDGTTIARTSGRHASQEPSVLGPAGAGVYLE